MKTIKIKTANLPDGNVLIAQVLDNGARLKKFTGDNAIKQAEQFIKDFPMKDLLNNEIKLPNIGDVVLRDGYTFRVTEVRTHEDLGIVASITLRGESGSVEVGYYDYLLHKKA